MNWGRGEREEARVADRNRRQLTVTRRTTDLVSSTVSPLADSVRAGFRNRSLLWLLVVGAVALAAVLAFTTQVVVPISVYPLF